HRLSVDSDARRTHGRRVGVMTIRDRVRRVGRAVVGPAPQSPIARLIRADPRWDTFNAAIEYINYEAVPGDIVEFGVFTGVSLALFAKAYSFDHKGMVRRIVGLDSFEGLPGSGEAHARWQPGACARNRVWHPLIDVGDRVTPEVTRELF